MLKVFIAMLQVFRFMPDLKPHADLLLEASWEVCNKVGGIYTVVKSKADLVKTKYNDNYIMIGPLVPEKAKIEAQQAVPPKEIQEVFDELAGEGLNFLYGRWSCKGEPQVILVDSSNWLSKESDIKKYLWETYEIDSLASDWGFNEPMIWGYAVGRLMEKLCEKYHGKKIVGHFHEWLGGHALLYSKWKNLPVKTVFTTHATMLGRAIAGSGMDLYGMLDSMNPDEMAEKSGINDKYTTEKACVKNTDIFTTVSEITAIEAEKILGRKPDVLLPNGLDIEKFPTFEEASIAHRQHRDRYREFLSAFFFPYYKFDLEQSLMFFILGRYEFKNKGIDIFIKSLGELNQKMKKENHKKTVAAFFFIPAGVSGIKMQVLNNREQFEKISSYVHNNSQRVIERVLMNVMEGKMEDMNLFTTDEIHEMKRYILKFDPNDGPFLSTHNIHNEENDMMIKGLREAGLNNSEEDKVKVILFPVYLDGFDELLQLKYYDAIQGAHLGVFPSYYEPWGYTPLEAAALGVPAVTTDLAGFGRYLEKNCHLEEGGIQVIERLGKSDESVTKEMTSMLYNYTLLSRNERVQQKMRAKALSEQADWKNFVNCYIDAHNKATEK
jgi:glycogen(starch) synthase